MISAILLTLLSYWPSFNVPFYLDDRISLAENPILKSGSIEQVWQIYGMRFIGYLSFWLNNQLLDEQLLNFQNGVAIQQVLLHYHITNLVIHLVNGLLILAIVKMLVKKLAPQLSDKQGILFSTLVMALWLLHPLNTQAVTYTIQRLASLVTLFYLLALFSYLKIRLFNFSLFQLALFVTAVCLGMLTKQNFIVLFLLIYCIELLFIDKNNKKIKMTSIFLLFFIALIYPFYTEFFTQLSNLTKETQAITRFEYFNTQLIVLGMYVYKFLIPINLQLEMGIELVKESSGVHFIAFIIHCLIITYSIILIKKIPLITIGVLIFYTGHTVESSIIPITDLAFEHRTYLPNIGLVLVVVSACFYFLQGTKNSQSKVFQNKAISGKAIPDKGIADKAIPDKTRQNEALNNLVFPINILSSKSKPLTLFAITISIITILTLLTYNRNTLWQNPEDFYLVDYQRAPESARAMESYGLVLIKNKKFAEGEELLRKSVNKNLKSGKITVTSLNNLISVLFQQKKYQSAISTAMVALKYINKPKERSQVLSTIAFGYISLGYCDFSIGLSTSALKLNPQNTQALKYQQYCHKQLSK
jgi:hypothetical protein